MGAVYVLTLRQLSGKWRLIIMTVLAFLPVLLAWLSISDDHAPTVVEFEAIALSGMLAGTIAPLVVLAIAASAFANELDDRTIANLFLAPIPRWQIVLPKLLASITLSAPFIAASAIITAHVAFGGDGTATLAVTVGALAGVALYAAAFVWLGLITPQAIGLGLLYIVLWEGFFSGYVAGVRLFSIRFHALAVMRALDARRFTETDLLSPTAAGITVVMLLALFVALAVRRLRRMDIP